jgi:hypothetical protein
MEAFQNIRTIGKMFLRYQDSCLFDLLPVENWHFVEAQALCEYLQQWQRGMGKDFLWGEEGNNWPFLGLPYFMGFLRA